MLISMRTVYCVTYNILFYQESLSESTKVYWESRVKHEIKKYVYTYIRLKSFDGISYSTFSRNRFIPYMDVTCGWTDAGSHL